MKITVYAQSGTPVQAIPVPAEQRRARRLWAFLVANLQTGFQVMLDDGTGQITRASAQPLPTHLFERLLSGARLDELR